jgi:hypothetical protein
MQGFYVTLSYICGPPTSNIQKIEMFATQELKMKDFPNIIRSAVSVTHNLDLHYLWIDALCILQDSVQDKIRQISMMRSIYQNSYVTIIATCGKNVNEGFLHQRRPQKIPDARIPYRCRDRNIGSIWIAEIHDARPNDCSRSYYVDLKPINYCGWCLQERLLSSRYLISPNDRRLLRSAEVPIQLPSDLLWKRICCLHRYSRWQFWNCGQVNGVEFIPLATQESRSPSILKTVL